MADLGEIFAPSGDLARYLPHYTYRAGQQQMAEWVGSALAGREHLVIEAGTGIGKTFAYLVPVLLSGQRAIISTGTRTLQDQLFARDLPLLGAAIGRPVEVALLKGRSNYLCLRRLALARNDETRDPSWRATLETVASWGRTTQDGDLTELEDLPEASPLRGWVSSTVDNCLGTRCECFEDCFLVEARRRAQAAQVVIVNHHLLLADLALKESGFGELLPGADAVIVDEAHQLPDVAQQFFGATVSSRELELLARDVAAEASLAGTAIELRDAATELTRAALAARERVGNQGSRLPWHAAPEALRATALDWQAGLETLAATLAPCRESGTGLARCWERCQDRLAELAAFHGEGAEQGLRWVDTSGERLALHWTPLDTGPRLAERITQQGGAWIFTSATLAVGEDFGHFLGRIGLPESRACVLASPFDYAQNARLFLPQGLPMPDQDDYVESLLATVAPLLAAARGGAFLLFTSYRALNIAAHWFAERGAPGPLLVQGSGPRTELLTRFRAAGDAILLGTSSFWQGVDVRGPALRLVIIDRLPFASPGDPLVQARVQAIRRDGGDAFLEFQLPQAVLTLKQGVGRLIRDFADRGLIVLGDPRLMRRAYGRVFLASLPPMPIIDNVEEAEAFLTALAPDVLPAAQQAVQ